MYIAFLLATGILIGAGFVLALQWVLKRKGLAYTPHHATTFAKLLRSHEKQARAVKLPSPCKPEVEQAVRNQTVRDWAAHYWNTPPPPQPPPIPVNSMPDWRDR